MFGGGFCGGGGMGLKLGFFGAGDFGVAARFGLAAAGNDLFLDRFDACCDVITTGEVIALLLLCCAALRRVSPLPRAW